MLQPGIGSKCQIKKRKDQDTNVSPKDASPKDSLETL